MGRLYPCVGAVTCAALLGSPVLASESTTYTYDALGRLVVVSVSGGPNDGHQSSTSFDSGDNRTNYSVGGAPAASFSVADVTVTEGAAAAVIVTRSGATAGTATIDYATSNGSAAAPGDYSSTSGTLTFAPGEASKSISIPTTNDSAFEDTESFSVTISNPSAGTGIANAGATVTILDDEIVPKLAISDVTIAEGSTAILTVSRSGLTSTAVGVNYATVAGSAIPPGDFTTASGTLNFAAGETSKTISVPTVNDTIYEGPETFSVALSGATGGAFVTNGVGTVTITDDDVAPSFAISSASATEGGTITFTVTKTGTTANSLSVNYGTANGSAIAPGDYGATSGTLTFLPGETSKTITVSTVNDTTYEMNETFSVYLSGATGGASIASPTGTGTINDNDAMPTLSVANTTVIEGQHANVTVMKSGATDVNVTVSYAASGGTAPTSDYGAATGSLTFLPEEASKTIVVPTVDNVKTNIAARTFNVDLSNPVGASIGSSPGIVTIQDNDTIPNFTTLNPTSQDEGGTIYFAITLNPSISYDTPITVNYSTSSGTATSGTDFTATSGTATFVSPGSVVVVPVPTIQDAVVEPDETILFTISSPSFGTIGSPSQAVGTIKNDDIPPSVDPIANTDNAGTSFARCDTFTINPITNDTSPSGKYPLTLVSVATGTGYTRTISGNNVTIFIKAAGAKSIQYVVANSAGAQSTGAITWTAASGPVCL